ncbi:MAG: DNA pilot protein [Wigfec virus K19_170]|nr:MAG: DNA pilot protein [Wigfec virus K19_170]
MGFFKDVGKHLSNAATGGAWNTAGTGMAQGGTGMGEYLGMGTSAKELIPGIGDAIAQDKANKLNLSEAQTNRDFQERMSNTAYQRGMDDMKKAGLNPMLAFSQGGASSPSGSTATVQSASKTGLFDAALKATTGIGSLSQQKTALDQQQSMNQSAITLNATTAAKNTADAQKTLEETKGLGKKASEGALWDKFYKGINNVLDSSAKDTQRRNKSEPPLIKKLPGNKASDSKMFKWLNKGVN